MGVLWPSLHPKLNIICSRYKWVLRTCFDLAMNRSDLGMFDAPPRQIPGYATFEDKSKEL